MQKHSILISLLLITGFFALLTYSCKKDDTNTTADETTVKDIEGNIYKTVKIGGQIWMVENLRTTHFNDSTAIPNVTDASKWNATSTLNSYCSFNNTSNTDTINTYGYLYNWYAVNTGKLCPKGWHVPIEAEWDTLIAYLGGGAVAGGKLKESGIVHWENPNEGANNSSGFSALPGGLRVGGDYSLGFEGYWWSSTEDNIALAWGYCLKFSYKTVNKNELLKGFGYSVRCIKDKTMNKK